MDLNQQIERAAHYASEAELNAAAETIEKHLRYRRELAEHGRRGGRLPAGRPPWADPGRRRRGGHVS